MKMLKKLAGALAARYVCQTCEKEKERRAVAHNATKCLERNTLLAESNQAASLEIHRLKKALAKAELERDVAPVVRCKDCRHSRYAAWCEGYACCRTVGEYHRADFGCTAGELQTNGVIE